MDATQQGIQHVEMGNCCQVQFELTAVVLHSGVTAYSGHYMTVVTRQTGWMRCNDRIEKNYCNGSAAQACVSKSAGI